MANLIIETRATPEEIGSMLQEYETMIKVVIKPWHRSSINYWENHRDR